ncbi:MAG TPA: hypothetical protein VGQ69_15555 [Gemmatimonadales bacterium]|jgi:hypothetical protein|nr:hypothetical protein [Gemmatimonadales bacterium]
MAPRLAAVCLAFVLPGRLMAQASAAPVRLVPVILGFPSSVQAAGLAGAGVALPGYAGAIFVNPAGIAPIRVLSLEAGFSRRPDHSTYAMAAAATRAGRFNLGFGARYLLFSADSATYDNLSWSGAVVYRLGGIAFGASTKYVSVEQRDGPITRSLTGDLAVQVAFFDIAALALSAQNLAQSRLSGAGLELPEALHLGFSLNLLDTYSNGRLLATVESVWSAGERGRTVFGLEAGAAISGLGIVGRVGTGRPPGLVGDVQSHTTFGGSLLLGRARLDYAYQQRSTLGRAVHLFGARWTP